MAHHVLVDPSTSRLPPQPLSERRPRELDLRGMGCPLPVLHTRRALARGAAGDRLTIRCNDPMAAIDIPHLLACTGDRLESQDRTGDELVFHVRKLMP